MTIADFMSHFDSYLWNFNPALWKESYWMALGNADTIGVSGSSSYCGKTCKRSVFNVTSSVAQTVYVQINLHDHRQYIGAPCDAVGTSTASP